MVMPANPGAASFPAEVLTISGEATRFERTADSGNGFESFFCPSRGSTVYVRATARPEMTGLAVGSYPLLLSDR